MIKNEKDSSFMEIVKGGLDNIKKIILSSIFPPVLDGAEIVIRRIENRLIIMEKQILRRITTFMIICFGGVFLIFSFLFFQIEFLGLSKTMSFFLIGIIILIIGLILKFNEYNRR